MPIKVIDASALAAILFDEPGVDAVLEQLIDSGLAAPHLLAYEIANVCLNKIQKKPALQEALFGQFQSWRRMGIVLYMTPESELVSLALQTGLTVYDAAYLHLTMQLSVDLVSLDRDLIRAFRRLGE